MIINGWDMLAQFIKLNKLILEFEQVRTDSHINQYVVPPLIQAINNLALILKDEVEKMKEISI